MEMKNDFDGLNDRLDMLKERFSQLQDTLIESSKKLKYKENKDKPPNSPKYPKTVGQHTCNRTTRRRKKKREEIFEIIITENFPKLTLDTKPQIQKSKRKSNRINAKTNKQLYVGISFTNCRK